MLSKLFHVNMNILLSGFKVRIQSKRQPKLIQSNKNKYKQTIKEKKVCKKSKNMWQGPQ